MEGLPEGREEPVKRRVRISQEVVREVLMAKSEPREETSQQTKKITCVIDLPWLSSHDNSLSFDAEMHIYPTASSSLKLIQRKDPDDLPHRPPSPPPRL